MGIEELEKYVETLPPVIQHSNFYRDRVWADKSSLLYFVGKIKQQLKSSLPTQQDKVVVPEFVAEYLEMRKDQFQIGGLGVAIMHVFDGKESPKLFNWMNNNVEIFARAWLDGYTVEKERLYYVILAEKKVTGNILIGTVRVVWISQMKKKTFKLSQKNKSKQ